MEGLRRRGARVVRVGRPGDGGGERCSGRGEEPLSEVFGEGELAMGEWCVERMISSGMIGEGISPMISTASVPACGEEGMLRSGGEKGAE